MKVWNANSKLEEVVRSYMQKAGGVKSYCRRCLETERWGGSVLLMIVDAAFTSIGLNYFTAVVPKVEEFESEFVKTGKIRNLRELSDANIEELKKVWRNERSWRMAREIARFLASLCREKNIDEREALRLWAKGASLENWEEDAIGKISGVGINTFQYLRMMGGIDTCMPDKIVKRVINQILREAGRDDENRDMRFIKKVDEIAKETGYRAIELCWMTWLVQSEGGKIRSEKYSEVLKRI